MIRERETTESPRAWTFTRVENGTKMSISIRLYESAPNITHWAADYAVALDHDPTVSCRIRIAKSALPSFAQAEAFAGSKAVAYLRDLLMDGVDPDEPIVATWTSKGWRRHDDNGVRPIHARPAVRSDPHFQMM
jgi:hypothetical protein